MNPLALYFASGESLYSGAVLLLFVIAGSPYARQRWHLLTRNILAWIALAMMVMASPPFPFFIGGTFLLAFGLWFISWNLSVNRRVPQLSSAVLLAVLVVLLPASEFRHRFLPTLSGTPSDHLVVIGDSISSGINPLIPPWPAVMQQMTGERVVNLARPGAYVSDGLDMADKLQPNDRLILIEIGGNDLLTGMPASEFGFSLDALLRKVATPGRTVVMFELPLLVWRVEYGQVQRALAGRYRVHLIPKRYLTYVIGGPKATSDGLHLLPDGEHRMAVLVGQVFSQVLNPNVASAN